VPASRLTVTVNDLDGLHLNQHRQTDSFAAGGFHSTEMRDP
jgi:hypothetical protein